VFPHTGGKKNRRNIKVQKMDPREKISEHVSFEEAMASSTAERLGIDNTPSAEIIEVMKRTANAVFEPVRNFYNCRIAIGSFFRSPSLNAVLVKDPNILASKKSQHCLGEAMDLNARVFGHITNKQLFDHILAKLEFDQLIWEEGTDEEPEWVHVSIKTGEGAKNRKEVLRKFRDVGKTWYEKL
jgi:zinc D-Ala-D-Ala carboxypeptidase